MAVIELQHVTKKYAAIVANKDISLNEVLRITNLGAQKNIAEVLVEQVANLKQVGIKCQAHTEASKVDMYFTNLENSFELKISNNGSKIVDNTTQSNGIKGNVRTS